MAVKGIPAITQLVSSNFAKWGLGNDPHLVATYVGKSGIESGFGEANNGSGNGVVKGTWQMDEGNVDGLMRELKDGSYPSLSKPTQQKMYADLKAIYDKHGGNLDAVLKDQNACLITTVAMQAERKRTLKAGGVDVDSMIARDPSRQFEYAYIMHQLPIKDMESVMGAIQSGKLNDPIGNHISGAVISSNPSTYKGVKTVGDFLNLLNSKEVNAPAGAAVAGVTLPSASSMSAVALDLAAHGKGDLAKIVQAVENIYQGQNGAIPEKQRPDVVEALKVIKKNVNDVFAQFGITKTDSSEMLALHVGSHSAAAILKAPDNALLKDISHTSNGKTIKPTKESVEAFVAEMRAAGVSIPANETFDTLTAGEMKGYATQFYNGQVQHAARLTQRAGQKGGLTQKESNQMDSMQAITQALGPEMGGFMSMVVMLIGFLSGAQQQPAAQQVQGQAQAAGNPRISGGDTVPSASPPSPTPTPTTSKTLVAQK
jgi:hypothetical protein